MLGTVQADACPRATAHSPQPELGGVDEGKRTDAGLPSPHPPGPLLPAMPRRRQASAGGGAEGGGGSQSSPASTLPDRGQDDTARVRTLFPAGNSDSPLPLLPRRE